MILAVIGMEVSSSIFVGRLHHLAAVHDIIIVQPAPEESQNTINFPQPEPFKFEAILTEVLNLTFVKDDEKKKKVDVSFIQLLHHTEESVRNFSFIQRSLRPP